jgi:hypothetical protein
VNGCRSAGFSTNQTRFGESVEVFDRNSTASVDLFGARLDRLAADGLGDRKKTFEIGGKHITMIPPTRTRRA